MLDRLPRTISVAAWTVPVLVVVQFAWLATLPVVVVLVGAFASPRARRLRWPAVALAVTYAVPYVIWKTRPDPAPSLSKDIHPVLAALVVAVALLVVAVAHRRSTRPVPVAGAALTMAALVTVVAEAVVAAAWDRRPYSYWDDTLTVLGTPDTGRIDGTLVSSPLWWLMDSAWIVAGVLATVAGVSLARRVGGRTRLALLACAGGLGVGLVLFAVFHKDPSTQAQGTIALYWLGAGLTLLAGNLFAVVAGLAWRPLGLPRWVGRSGVALGVIGLVAVAGTYGWLALGAAERISVYGFLAWQLLAGTALIVSSRAAAPDTGADAGDEAVPGVSGGAARR